MGNRAVITVKNEQCQENEIGVYVHWNGSFASVEAFLAYCYIKGYRKPEEDNYGWARLCQVIGNYFGGGTSLGIDICRYLDYDNWDNGMYYIKDWHVVGREFNRNESDEYVQISELVERVLEINQCQPKNEKLDDSVILVGCREYREYWMKGKKEDE